jgi:hypothetical protein
VNQANIKAIQLYKIGLGFREAPAIMGGKIHFAMKL